MTTKDDLFTILTNMGFNSDATRVALYACKPSASLYEIIDVLTCETPPLNEQQVPHVDGELNSEDDLHMVQEDTYFDQEQHNQQFIRLYDPFSKVFGNSGSLTSKGNGSRAIAALRERKRKREEEAERAEKEKEVNIRLVTWKSSQGSDLKGLLSSLQYMLWPNIQWEVVTRSELLEPKKCKKVYMKAISKVHPDKLALDASVEQRLLANGIFITLNQAWAIFKTDNCL